MKIVNKNPMEEVVLAVIEQGQCFQVCGEIYIKTNLINGNDHNAANPVNLTGGVLAYFNSDDKVLPRPDLIVTTKEK